MAHTTSWEISGTPQSSRRQVKPLIIIPCTRQKVKNSGIVRSVGFSFPHVFRWWQCLSSLLACLILLRTRWWGVSLTLLCSTTVAVLLLCGCIHNHWLTQWTSQMFWKFVATPTRTDPLQSSLNLSRCCMPGRCMAVSIKRGDAPAAKFGDWFSK